MARINKIKELYIKKKKSNISSDIEHFDRIDAFRLMEYCRISAFRSEANAARGEINRRSVSVGCIGDLTRVFYFYTSPVAAHKFNRSADRFEPIIASFGNCENALKFD